MIVGTTKELKNHEYRVGLTPDGVRALCQIQKATEKHFV